MTAPAGSDTYAPFRYRDFNLFQTARALSIVASQMLSVAVGWQVFQLTGRALDLGLAGLAEFLPAVVLALFAGDVVDRHARRFIIQCTNALFVVCALWLAYAAYHPRLGTPAIYAALVVYGVGRAFAGPANQAILPDIVPVEHYPRAVAWSETLWQGAAIAGPALGGLLFAAAHHAAPVFLVAAAMWVTGAVLLAFTRVKSTHVVTREKIMKRLFAGLSFVWNNKLVLGAISLDLFAVLLGGAVALLPMFAYELGTRAWGLGLLRAAPSVGAALMAIVIAHRPITRRAGYTLLACVGLFGVATIVFGLSHHFALSMLALVVVGATDMVSVVVRHTLVQLGTPNEMRGRVSAVNSVFIGASNQLGEFESGITAQWLGARAAVVVGGLGTIAVVGLWGWLFPRLRKVDNLIDG